MKHFIPERHPSVPEAARRGQTVDELGLDPDADSERLEPELPRSDAALPHQKDESSHSQASATPAHEQIGRKAYENATDGTQDTDRGPVMDQVYHDTLAPHRGSGPPRH
jgi:hypothetical protein